MYKKLLPAALSFVLLSGVAVAQDINLEKVSFNYMRLPLQPLPKEAKTFSGKVEIAYKEEVEAAKEARQQEVEDIKATAAAEKAEYKQKSLGAKAFSKIILDEGKPKGPVIGKDPYVAKIHDGNSLANSYVQIPGYSRQDADVQVTVLLHGFSVVDVVPQTRESMIKKDGKDITTTYYYYEVSYNHPITLRVQNKVGQVLYESPIEALSELTVTKTGEYKTEAGLEKHWSVNQNSFLRGLDEAIILKNMNIVKEELASQYGYNPMLRATTVLNIKDKKVSYDDFNQAFESATIGYSKLANQEKKTEAIAELEKALELWNNALKEADPNNKKARVDAKVAAATHLNCAEAYMWLNNFEEAEKHLNKVKMLDVSKYENLAKELQVVLADQKSRYNSSQNNM